LPPIHPLQDGQGQAVGQSRKPSICLEPMQLRVDSPAGRSPFCRLFDTEPESRQNCKSGRLADASHTLRSTKAFTRAEDDPYGSVSGTETLDEEDVCSTETGRLPIGRRLPTCPTSASESTSGWGFLEGVNAARTCPGGARYATTAPVVHLGRTDRCDGPVFPDRGGRRAATDAKSQAKPPAPPSQCCACKVGRRFRPSARHGAKFHGNSIYDVVSYTRLATSKLRVYP
jgi:hypothetical protein